MRARFLAVIASVVIAAGCGGSGGGGAGGGGIQSPGGGGSHPAAGTPSPLSEVPLKSSFDIALTYDGQHYAYSPFEEIGSSRSKFSADPGGFLLDGEYRSSDGNIDLNLELSSDQDHSTGTIKVSSDLVLSLLGLFPPSAEYASVHAANGECTIKFAAYNRSSGINGTYECVDLVASNGKHLTFKGSFSGKVR